MFKMMKRLSSFLESHLEKSTVQSLSEDKVHRPFATELSTNNFIQLPLQFWRELLIHVPRTTYSLIAYYPTHSMNTKGNIEYFPSSWSFNVCCRGSTLALALEGATYPVSFCHALFDTWTYKEFSFSYSIIFSDMQNVV